MLVSINGVDLTPYIDQKSYSMNADKIYTSWEDGNYREHRVYTRYKVKGSFDVKLFGQNGMTTQNFLNIWNGGVTNEVATLLVFVQNHNQNEAIEAYFDFVGTFHKEMINGSYCDKLTIKITER